MCHCWQQISFIFAYSANSNSFVLNAKSSSSWPTKPYFYLYTTATYLDSPKSAKNEALVNVIQVLPSTLQECLEVFQLYMLYTAYICKQLKIKASSKTFLFGSLSQLLYVLLPKVQQAFLRMCTRLGLADLRLNCYCCCFCCVLKICTQNWVHKLHKFSSP